MGHPLIIFQHQPKAGGTSLRALLMRQFPPEATLNVRPVMKELGPRAADRRRIRGKRYFRFLETGFPSFPVSDPTDWKERLIERLPMERRASCRLVLGHFAYGIHELFPRPATYITMLRDPIDRILSMWAVLVRQGTAIGFHEYLQTARDWELTNGQIRRVIGTSVPQYRWIPLTGDLLERAKERLRGFGVVGTAERYAETLELLGRTFGWKELAEERLNSTPARIRKEDLSQRLLSRLEELNRYDLELHRYANELMDEQLARAAGGATG